MITPEEKRIIREWTDYKQFKDPVYGYIPVNRPYVQYLIDTQLMQRIKGVAQTGLRPVFSSATHDRFSHSLGVFKFGMEMYDSLVDKLRSTTESLFAKWDVESSVQTELKNLLKHWKVLLAIASLLHDIGHPVQSHGFEFLFDDPYLDVRYNPDEEPLIIGDSYDERVLEEQNRVFALLKEIKKNGEKTPEGNLSKALLEAFHSHNDPVKSNISGAPHERMSAYYILNDNKLISNVKTLIRASREMASLDLENAFEINQDICFIARMIIGLEYPAEEQLSFNKSVFFNSVKNCIIHILNGKIDADGIDYLMRNSYSAGYDTSKIDSTRLCNAYTAYEKNYVMFPAFSKSALSILEGYMSARNFEPKWLYSHHKVVYADLLTKRLYKYITRYITDQTMLLRSVRLFLSHAEESALVFNGEQSFGSDLMLIPNNEPIRLNAKEFRAHMEQWSYPFYTYLIAPCRRYTICSRHFCKTADADLDALFHWMGNELAPYKTEADPQKRYSLYTQHLKKHVIDNIGSLYLNNNVKALRILFAETCLEKVGGADNKLADSLKKWIETASTDAAQKCLEVLRGNSSYIDQSLMRGLSGNDAESLLNAWMDQYLPLLNMDDFTEFFSLLDEFETRSFRKSLWKSYPEYQLFIKECADQLGYSSADVSRYMVKLIEDGMKKHGFSIFEGKAVKNPPELYREQFFYQQDKIEMHGNRWEFADAAESRNTGSSPQKKDWGKLVAQKWANVIFNDEDYDFSCTKLVVTFYRIKSKRFDGIPLLFNNRPIPLETVLSTNGGADKVFPYFYIIEDKTSQDTETLIKKFQKDFIKYCREYRENETRSEVVKMEKDHIFRDSIYGDIKVPDRFYAVICTREFQRLGRIRQLATADRAFPNATHTRFAHSIGTWYVMKLILQHFRHLYQFNPQLLFTAEDENIALLAALLHDLGHGPYSHVIENAFDKEHFHEEMTRRIIQDGRSEISIVIKEKFGEHAVERVCKLLDDSPTPGDTGIGVIYHTLISGQLDADRIDYLMRDNAACGMSFGHIDIQQLIESMRLLPEHNLAGSPIDYRLCFDDHYLAAIDQFIYARYQMYKNVYYNPVKLLFEQIIKRIFLQAKNLQDAIKKDSVLSVLMKIKDGDPVDVSEYTSLDDESMNCLIKKWAAGDILTDDSSASDDVIARKNILQMLSHTFLNRRILYERIDLGGKRQQYDLLAKRVSKQLGFELNTFQDRVPGTGTKFDEEYSAFIFVQGEVYAYKEHKGADSEKKNIILRSLDDGTTEDYIHLSMFLPASDEKAEILMKTDFSYLFFSKELLEKDCLIHGLPSIHEKISNTVESAKPRKHIEIEKKFYCSKKQLETAIEYISREYPDANKDEKDQTDTYYDCIVGDNKILLSEKFGFRCRNKGSQYIFTLKTPADSPNYDSAFEFARHEYELSSSDSRISDDVYEFLTDTISSFGKKELFGQLKKNKLQELLIVCNHRTTFRIEGKCEICLDEVKYKTPDGNFLDSEIYQIEIELLDEPERWTALEKNVINPLVSVLGVPLSSTTESKLERGLRIIETKPNN